MAYQLAIGDRMYSSWSLRGWLLFAAFGIPVRPQLLRLYASDFAKDLEAFDIARTVPALRIENDGKSQIVWDTLAIAETLHEENPKAGIWPSDPGDRARARSLAAEMHSGFSALRNHCQMTLISAFEGFDPPEAVRKDLARIEALWSYARDNRTTDGPWLFGTYSAADAFFAPVAARITTFKLNVGPQARDYVAQHLAHLPFRQWRAMGFAENRLIDVYHVDLPSAPWPGPAPLAAKAVSSGTAINSTCPYSNDPVASDSLAEIDGKIVGFCNSFCRDKSVFDPEAWPQLMDLLAQDA